MPSCMSHIMLESPGIDSSSESSLPLPLPSLSLLDPSSTVPSSGRWCARCGSSPLPPWSSSSSASSILRSDTNSTAGTSILGPSVTSVSSSAAPLVLVRCRFLPALLSLATIGGGDGAPACAPALPFRPSSDSSDCAAADSSLPALAAVCASAACRAAALLRSATLHSARHSPWMRVRLALSNMYASAFSYCLAASSTGPLNPCLTIDSMAAAHAGTASTPSACSPISSAASPRRSTGYLG